MTAAGLSSKGALAPRYRRSSGASNRRLAVTAGGDRPGDRRKDNRESNLVGDVSGGVRDKLQERRVERAGLGIHPPAATATGICDENIDPAPFLDDTRDHCLDRFVVADIDLDPQSGATRRLNLGDGAVGSYVFGFGLEFLYERRFRSAESPFPL
jgi:hypothetical protein